MMTQPLRTMIVDDEELARRGLEIRLEPYEDVEICGRARNGREAVALARELRPDLMFLDIQMPGMDGFDTLRELAGPDMPIVVFVTAFSEHALKAFDANALDYLLKPIDDRRLAAALERVREHREAREAADHRSRLLKLICDITGEELTLERALEGESPPAPRAPERLVIREGARTACVDVGDIDWIESAGDYLCIHAGGETHVLRGTMKHMESMLTEREFARVHRSTIVNLSRVRSYRSHDNGEYFLELEGAPEIKVSRSYRDCVDRIGSVGAA
ncbi:MAG: LytTR family DNA-binding domain-containing protein [Pseudomonadota bacterium]